MFDLNHFVRTMYSNALLNVFSPSDFQNPSQQFTVQLQKPRPCMVDTDTESGGGGAQNNASNATKEQDSRFLPISNVGRIMKKALPASAKISKEAKETVQECVSEFISFVTGEASDKCRKEKRKTINGDDLFWAMTTLGFEDYVEPLKVYLQRFREMEGEKPAVARVKDAPLGGGIAGGGGMYGIMVHQYQGHVYGSSGFHQMGSG